jgi:hypothetical protein
MYHYNDVIKAIEVHYLLEKYIKNIDYCYKTWLNVSIMWDLVELEFYFGVHLVKFNFGLNFISSHGLG